MKITNQDIQKASGFSYSQITEWATLLFGQEFVHTDNGREFTLSEAFKIHMLGLVLTYSGLNAKTAKLLVTILSIKQKVYPNG